MADNCHLRIKIVLMYFFAYTPTQTPTLVLILFLLQTMLSKNAMSSGGFYNPWTTCVAKGQVRTPSSWSSPPTSSCYLISSVQSTALKRSKRSCAFFKLSSACGSRHLSLPMCARTIVFYFDKLGAITLRAQTLDAMPPGHSFTSPYSFLLFSSFLLLLLLLSFSLPLSLTSLLLFPSPLSFSLPSSVLRPLSSPPTPNRVFLLSRSHLSILLSRFSPNV
jgi:hypothetical protein